MVADANLDHKARVAELIQLTVLSIRISALKKRLKPRDFSFLAQAINYLFSFCLDTKRNNAKGIPSGKNQEPNMLPTHIPGHPRIWLGPTRPHGNQFCTLKIFTMVLYSSSEASAGKA
jgi:hypothetical protein